MNMLKEFYSFANIKGRTTSLSIMLVLLSILYCSIYTMVISVAVRLNSIMTYYLLTYLFVLIAAYVFMIVMFQFARNKREDTSKLVMKKFMLPLIGVQTIFFAIMAGTSALSISMFMNAQQSIISYPLTVIMLLSVLFYIPMQIFSCFYIYDGVRNPFHIVKLAFFKIIHHYQSCFYSLLVLLIVTLGYSMIMSIVFDYAQPTFVLNSAVMEIMTHNNPFMNAFELGLNLTKIIQLLAPFLVSVVYGISMCVLLVFYYSFMVCIHDDNVKV